jgi:hypothetical protein
MCGDQETVIERSGNGFKRIGVAGRERIENGEEDSIVYLRKTLQCELDRVDPFLEKLVRTDALEYFDLDLCNIAEINTGKGMESHG